MNDLPAQHENRLPEDIFRTQIIQKLQKIRPVLIKQGTEMPDGFQMEIDGPDVQVAPQTIASQQLGVLNVTGASTEPLTIEYRSKSNGRNFALTVNGPNLLINGDASSDEINQALDLIFTTDGQINYNRKTVHASTTRNLASFDRDGNPLQHNNNTLPRRLT
jgi:hypothetical protein